ncbi:hypothetical protein [Erysipelothrix sp. strain 2 (EsS2-6-Brazil)]|uniref:hypothetical protein n=1 Tax=Erysipelothrix sp. strain 2 (EsS2-6-Brazil) TaxID=2500549 RepID=UPI00190CA2E6|nr:hypothetical protein [Erysipelothrix sp. strain 2 (EsS2-6-Brazil)]MDE8033225.1 hypothetical protein [Erysipelothrix rhusiopathiae]MBK2401973.1 hypothetical protein [Erysipelothrix sp. strain 2 (EsS2-6-Brazil)]MDE8323865.1 hypothetical protein [Erysipelothrix rhusiopathiae]MDE8328901.1 hypothetical protein [Erysipelothrix rhusiopathiae]MDE8332108.1 hypothetical protein [Erysipelothrix rhusiopathiae]
MRKVIAVFGCFMVFLMQLTPILAQVESIDIEDIDAPGTYWVRLQYHDFEGNPYWKVVEMTITKDGLNQDTETLKRADPAIINPETEGIDAQDLKIPRGSLERLTDLRFIELVKAQAWIEETGIQVPITTVIKEYGNTSETVLFKTERGTEKRVHVIPKSLNNVTWTSSPSDISSNNLDEGFQSVMFTHIKTTLLLLLLVPLIVISFMYLYTKKQIKEVDVLLYKKDQSSKL